MTATLEHRLRALEFQGNMKMIPVMVGTTLIYAPDYSVPGTKEAVEAEVAAGEEWPMGGSRLRYEMFRRNRRDERRSAP